jgi:phenylalanyl-tRNA synthetase beta chain
MKYSYNWLQSHIQEPLPTPESLKETIIFHAFEVEDVEEKNGLSAQAGDSVFDIKVLPDRAGDCLSHYGMAREIAGLLKLTLKSLTDAPLPEMPLLLPVEVKSELCRRYIAVRIDGVAVGESPAWLKERLEAVGQRSINNVVDATNFVLLDLGQPTHAFDSAKIDGGITVRLAHEGETIITLSEESKTLTPDMLVIADYVGALAIAGVKGGKTAEVSTSTTSVILEIANFDPVSVRKTARTLALPTDAAKRFENNLSPETARVASAMLASLIKQVAGGEITGVSDVYPAPVAPRTISFTSTDVARRLGEWVTETKIKQVFDTYRYEYTCTDGVFVLTVPTWRADITGAHDIAEEIGRVIGYDTIAPAPLPTVHPIEHSPVYAAIRAAKAWLVHDGYREVMTYTFRPKGDVEIARGAKGKSALRTNLSDAMKDSYELNRSNAPLLGISEVKLFEIGTVFTKDKEEVRLCIADKNGIKEMTVEAYIEEHKVVVESTTLEITPNTQSFTAWSVYPFSTRDIAVWVDGEEGKQHLLDIVTTFARTYCVRPAVLFDEFTKDGKTSVAYRFVFQSYDKTLTEAEIEEWMKLLERDITATGILTIR